MDSGFGAGSREVCWWAVHLFVERQIESVDDWPLAGSPAWVALDDADPRKLASVLSAGRHWALRIETAQAASIAASHAISSGENWALAAQRIRTRAEAERSGGYIARQVTA